jgi:hypothetical protein
VFARDYAESVLCQIYTESEELPPHYENIQKNAHSEHELLEALMVLKERKLITGRTYNTSSNPPKMMFADAKLTKDGIQLAKKLLKGDE